MKAIEIKHLSFKYKNAEKNVLNNINLYIDDGEAVTFTGRSGSGKSTLCSCICGLIPDLYSGELSGDIFIYGKRFNEMTMAEKVANIGIIFQNPATQLFSPTIEDELAFGPENLCVNSEEIGKRIDSILKIINMESYRFENPNNLSGGQQQLVAIASVLMLNPKIIICDEIMSWVDEEGRDIIKNLLLKLKNEGKTLIIVDHNSENIEIADRIIHIGA